MPFKLLGMFRLCRSHVDGATILAVDTMNDRAFKARLKDSMATTERAKLHVIFGHINACLKLVKSKTSAASCICSGKYRA